MKPAPFFKQTGLSLLAWVFCTAALASGTHAGGHDGSSASIGEAGDPAKVTRTIAVEMKDTMRFTPDAMTARSL